MVHVASPMLLEGRGSSRSGGAQIQQDALVHNSHAMRPTPDQIANAMISKGQSPQKSQQIQNY